MEQMITNDESIKEKAIESKGEKKVPSARKAKPGKAKVVKKADELDVRILKVSTCPSLSGRSELTYHIGCVAKLIYLRLFLNTGKGYFNREWIPFNSIKEVITNEATISAASLRQIFVGKSVNTGGFFLAVLKDLKLIQNSLANPRIYTKTGSDEFEKEMDQLIESDVSLDIKEDEMAGKRKKAQGKDKEE